MKIPEVILFNSIEGLLLYLRKDFDDNSSDETNSLLYRLFKKDDNGNDLKINTFDYYAGAKSLFLRDEKRINQLTVNLGYNLERAKSPTIHILLPQENKGRMDGIGHISGTSDTAYDLENQVERQARSYSFTATYSLIITSGNSAEITLIYSLLKTCLPLIEDHLEINGLSNLKIGGQDIRFTDNFGPDNIFHRDMSLQFDYDNEVSVDIVRDMSDDFQLFICSNIGDKYQKYLDEKLK